MKTATFSRFAALAVLFAAGLSPAAFAQGRGGAPQPPKSPKDAAPIDVTGYWVSIITEDWRWRMVTPAKGDYASVPITVAAQKVADAWDPAKDEAAGEQCRSYGAPAVMRIPGRLHVTWQDGNSLKIETDAGTQTRTFQFGPAASGAAPSWQGQSSAQWEPSAAKDPSGKPQSGNLKVVTGNLRPGYLRKNGVPYSANTKLTEYYDLMKEDNGDQWLVVTTIVEDPQYLQIPFITTTHFKKQADGAGWDPSPCSSRW